MPGITIEVAGRDVGIAVPDGTGFRFFASDRRFAGLEDQRFRTARHAARAATSHLQNGRPAFPSPRDDERSAALPPGYGTEIIRTDEALHRLLPEWWGLWHRAERGTPFNSPGWLLPWWTTFRPGELVTVALRRHGELVALAPLYRETGAFGRRLLPLGMSVSDALDVLVDPRCREVARDGLLLALAAEGSEWDSLHLEELPHNAEALGLRLPDGYGAETSTQSAHPVLALDRGPIPALRRIEKARRRAERRGELHVVETVPSEVPGAIDDLFRLHAAGWSARGEPGVLADDLIQEFHRRAIPLFHAAGIARLLRLEIAGRVAAVLYGFSHRGRVCAYLSGFDPAFAFESPGAILLDAFIRQAAREGAREFDFLRGQELYKYDWGATDRWTMLRVITPRR